MSSGPYFKRIRNRRSLRAPDARSNDETLSSLLTRCVVERFARISEVRALVIPLDLSNSEDTDDPLPNPGHPACAEHADSDYCRESWQLHEAELRLRPETHWHKCDFGKLCALVPVVCRDQCVAVIKLACPASIDEDQFECHVELLDVLVEHFTISEADSLDRLLRSSPPAETLKEPPVQSKEEAVERPTRHPQILRAIDYIEGHLSDPKLTVRCVARELDIHPNYLSQLFADQVGRRMSRFITARRVEKAKTLLATTDWQIKRIATATGHANPNWFCNIFSVYTGVAPGAYRRQSRRHSRVTSTR